MHDAPIFEDARSRALLDHIRRFAAKNGAVLIVGPTGSGKEVIARLLHEHSQREAGPFVPVHCGAISEKLFESAFFGHVKGAFSGAAKDHEGYLAEAEGGTLFLDELGELPLEHQVKLLRVLDGHPYRPVGCNKDRRADIRFIGATNRDLVKMCTDGRFREDLYGRISHFVIEVPPLDERPADVRALARLYADQHRPGDTAFADQVEAAAARLGEHPAAWPLGIRQIQAFVSRADCLGVDEAEAGMRSEWERRYRPASAVVLMPQPDSDDRQALAGLIQAHLGSRRGKPMLAASRASALALADHLIGGTPIPYDTLQDTLGRCDRRTLLNNLKPLVEVGLLLEDGDQVTVRWPPVIVRLLRWQDDAWVTVPPGAIPMARSGDRFRIEVTAQLPMELQVFAVTHRREGSEPRQRIAHKLITRNQTKAVELQLDEVPGFEQILVHLAWPNKRGFIQVEPEAAALDVLRPHVLQRERMRLVEHTGPGWVEEWLVHHL